MAEDGWNSRDPERVALAYTPDSRWRNRHEFPRGREQIRAFLAATPDATLVPLHAQDTPDCPGRQFLPGEAEMDGFYYAKLFKL